MKIALVTGTVTATTKDPKLSAQKLLVTDVIDGRGKVLEPCVVAADTCGAGVGDTVLVTTGSGARVSSASSGLPVDATIVAIVEHLSISKN
ncbi:MAG: EutN/CcmL family microcompartment protein [Sedimentitalea sp.]